MPTGSKFMVCLHEWLIFYGINVGKHTYIPMDPMGYQGYCWFRNPAITSWGWVVEIPLFTTGFRTIQTVQKALGFTWLVYSLSHYLHGFIMFYTSQVLVCYVSATKKPLAFTTCFSSGCPLGRTCWCQPWRQGPMPGPPHLGVLIFPM